MPPQFAKAATNKIGYTAGERERERESLFATTQRTNIQKYTKYISSGRLPER